MGAGKPGFPRAVCRHRFDHDEMMQRGPELMPDYERLGPELVLDFKNGFRWNPVALAIALEDQFAPLCA